MTSTESKTILCKILDLIHERSILNHPFYRMWSAGTLTREAVREYSKQYYHFVKSYPPMVEEVLSNCPFPKIKEKIRINLEDELRHPELWLQFATAIGCIETEVRGSKPSSGTLKLIGTFKDIVSKSSFVVGAASLLTYEEEIPRIAEAKIRGLVRFYGIDDPKALEFFVVHRESDVAHANVWKEIISNYAGQFDTPQQILLTVSSSIDALWNMLNQFMLT